MKVLTFIVISTLLLINAEVSNQVSLDVYDYDEDFQVGVIDNINSVSDDNCKKQRITTKNVPDAIDDNITEMIILGVNCFPSSVHNLKEGQLDEILKREDIITKLTNKTMQLMYIDNELGKKIEKEIPIETLAMFIQFRAEFARFLAPGTILYEHIQQVMKQREFLKLLKEDFVAKIIEDWETIRRLLDTESIRIGLEIFPELHLRLGNESLSDEKFLNILPCDVFRRAADDTKFLYTLSPEVLYKMNLLSNISRDDGSKTDFYQCLGTDLTKKLFNDKVLMSRLSKDNMVQIINEKCCKSFDINTTKVALEIFPDLSIHIDKSLFLNDKFLEIIPCDEIQKRANDSNFIDGLSAEALYKINLLTNIKLEDGSTCDFYHCVGTEITKKLLTNKTLITRLSRDNVAHIMNEKCCKFFDKNITDTVLTIHQDLPLYLNDRALTFGLWYFENQSFLNRMPCPVYMHAVSNTTFVERLDNRALKAMSKNKHFWRCIPIEYVRHMMETSTIGSKLSIEDALEAAKVMGKVHAVDTRVIYNIFKHQFPQMQYRLDDIVLKAKVDAGVDVSKFKFRRGYRDKHTWYSFTDFLDG